MKFGAAFIQKPLDEGLSKSDVSDLFDMLKGVHAIPIEIQGNNTVAMGFVNLTDAELMDYDLKPLKAFVGEIISDTEKENEMGQYIFHFDGAGEIDVYIGYEEIPDDEQSEKTRNVSDIEITGITLLSTEEAENIPRELRSMHDFWWLRSPGCFEGNAAIVKYDGLISLDGYYVDRNRYGVRPALIFDPESSDLKLKDEFRMAGYNWTVITENMALCNGIIAYKPFREDWQAKDANNYEKSDIKTYLENWAKENDIIVTPKKKIATKRLPDTFKYWSNSTGDLFTPDLETRKNIYINELPEELQRAYDMLWSEDYGFRCFLTELDGKYGIAIEDEFEEATAKDHGVHFEDLLEIEKEFAKLIESEYPEYQVFFEKDHLEWSDGSKSSVVVVFIPWDEYLYKVKAFVKNMTVFWKDVVEKFLNG